MRAFFHEHHAAITAVVWLLCGAAISAASLVVFLRRDPHELGPAGDE